MNTRFYLWLLLVLTLAVSARGQAPPAEQIESLIRQLGDEEFAVREAAGRKLAAIGGRARAALERATKDTDAEVALRAKGLLDGLPKLTHTLVDALGQPIPLAAVTIQYSRQPPSDLLVPAPVNSFSEEDGRIGIPEQSDSEFAPPMPIPAPASQVRTTVIVAHDDYGMARVELDRHSESTALQVPLVRRGTEAHKRALQGQLVTSDGAPVGGAVIHCETIRTLGEGLIEGRHPRGEVLSGSDGRFSYYLPPSEVRKSERGALIPANSRYELRITVPGNDSFFPWSARYANLAPVRIELPRAARFHRFRFESEDGGVLADPNLLAKVRVQFDRLDAGERYLTDLGPNAVLSGRKLLPGKYVAEYFTSGKTIQYEPLTVTGDSPEELTFKLPRPLTYRGRVIGGISGEPIAGAIVVGWSSTSRNNLALLTDGDWQLLKDAPSNPPADHPAIVRLNEFYGVQALVRTDRDGRFAVTQPTGQDFYGILAFDRDAVPFKVSVGGLKPDDKHEVDLQDFPLYPAARVVVRPAFEGERLAVCPRWLPADEGQPEWFARFKAHFNGPSHREFEYVHWLTLNEPQPLLVPAGLRFTLCLQTPYDDKWDDAIVEGLQLEPRATKEAGDVRFAANLPVSVRVVDPRGKPIEGVPVRQKYVRDNAWSVAHNTDKDGLAQFYFPRNSAGQFKVFDLPGPEQVRNAPNLLAKFTVGDEPPAQPATITLTDTQTELLLGQQK